MKILTPIEWARAAAEKTSAGHGLYVATGQLAKGRHSDQGYWREVCSHLKKLLPKEAVVEIQKLASQSLVASEERKA